MATGKNLRNAKGDQGQMTPPRIGDKVKEFRRAKGWSLADLSARTGISDATLSRIENDQTLVSAHNLYVLSQIFGVDITAFFETAPSPIRSGVRSITRAGEGIQLETARYNAQVLCTDLSNKKMHPALNAISVASLEEAGGLVGHAGEEFLFVLSGKLVLHTEYYAPLLLEAGDSIYFDGAMGHAYVNGGEEPAMILVVASTDLLGASALP